MKIKRVIAVVAVGAAVAGVISGCGTGKTTNGKITLEVGGWPTETQAELLERYNQYEKEFEEKYPNIDIVHNTYAFDTKTFYVKASAEQLPDLYRVFFTEADQIIQNGYSADITDDLERNGMIDLINPDMLEVVSDDNGRVFGLPYSVYAQGLMINKELFTKAGLVNADGSVKIPSTYKEVAEFAQIIKEKTGVAGFALPTTNNAGGWHLTNIAWSNGVEFEKQNGDGKWQASFDTQGFRDTLEFIRDLKWNRGVLPDNTVIDAAELYKLYGTGQVAMIISNPNSLNDFVTKYGMDKDNIVMAKMPGGNGGRYSQMGGDFWAMSPTLTKEQIDAAFKWLEFRGYTPEINEAVQRDKCESDLEQGKIVLPKELFDIWSDSERAAAIESINSEYSNVDMKNYEDYYNFDGVTIKPEVSQCCQELYSVLDGVIQEVITNKDVNIEELSKNAANNFQVNYLNKIN